MLQKYEKLLKYDIFDEEPVLGGSNRVGIDPVRNFVEKL